jgi:hypothetical protein
MNQSFTISVLGDEVHLEVDEEVILKTKRGLPVFYMNLSKKQQKLLEKNGFKPVNPIPVFFRRGGCALRAPLTYWTRALRRRGAASVETTQSHAIKVAYGRRKSHGDSDESGFWCMGGLHSEA